VRARVAAVGVAALILAGGAAASRPPARPLLFDPGHGSLGGVGLGDPVAKLERALGKPDRVVRLSGAPVYLWLRSDDLCTAWAQASTRSGALVVISYRGPVGSTRGDRNGTRLATVRRHWPRGWQLVRHVVGGRGPNYGRVSGDRSATFGFDEHGRLAGVALRASAQIWQPIVATC
jgi:hypothetical protein